MKKLSVIVPVHNAEKWVSETLESLINQTYQNIEVICVDDGSTDESLKILNEYKIKSEKIKVFSQKNGGVCSARNNGIENSTGEYLAFFDSDDYLELNAYETMINKLEEENSDIVFCEFTRFWNTGVTQKAVEESFDALVKNPQDIKYFLYSTDAKIEGDTLYTKDIHGSSCRSVYKASIIKENGIKFHTELKFAEDMIFVLEYLNRCKKVSYCSEHLAWFRGFTKPWTFRDAFEHDQKLLSYQIKVVENNGFYSLKEKKELIGYLKCSTYFSIINGVLMFKSDAEKYIKEYNKSPEFKKLLTRYNFKQKYKIKPDKKRKILFWLLKLKMYKAVKKFYPNKKY